MKKFFKHRHLQMAIAVAIPFLLLSGKSALADVVCGPYSIAIKSKVTNDSTKHRIQLKCASGEGGHINYTNGETIDPGTNSFSPCSSVCGIVGGVIFEGADHFIKEEGQAGCGSGDVQFTLDTSSVCMPPAEGNDLATMKVTLTKENSLKISLQGGV